MLVWVVTGQKQRRGHGCSTVRRSGLALTCLVRFSLIQILGPENDDTQFLAKWVIAKREENHTTVLTKTLWEGGGKDGDHDIHISVQSVPTCFPTRNSV